jgi:hypothetical protein
MDGWGLAVGASPGLHFEQARRSSRTHLFDAYEDAPNGSAHAVGMQSLREEDAEDDELEAATERTRLRAEERRRSHSSSPSTKSPGSGRS